MRISLFFLIFSALLNSNDTEVEVAPSKIVPVTVEAVNEAAEEEILPIVDPTGVVVPKEAVNEAAEEEILPVVDPTGVVVPKEAVNEAAEEEILPIVDPTGVVVPKEAVNEAAEEEILPVVDPTGVVVPAANPSLDSSYINQANVEKHGILDGLLFGVIIIILLFLSISNLTLLKWRQKYKDRLISFPESLIGQFENSNKKSDKAFNALKDFISGLSIFEKGNEKRFQDILNSFSLLQSDLEEKNLEIKKLKMGYDAQIAKKFSKRFIKILSTCEDIIRETSSREVAKEIGYLKEDILDALDLADVKAYKIKEDVSTKDKEVFGMPDAASWIKIPISDPEKFFKVKSCLMNGYYLDVGIKEVIQYPKIEVFIEDKNNE